MRPRSRSVAVVAGAWLLAACGSVPPPAASPADTSVPGATSTPVASSAPTTVADRLEADAGRIGDVLEALQAMADANDAIRAAGTGGYEASVDHVAAELEAIGFAVDTPQVSFTGFRDLGGTLEVGGRIFIGPDEVRALIYSPGGAVSGPVTVLDESGCSPADFAEVAPGDLVLTTEGGCFRRDQALNAANADAAALIVGYPDRAAGEIFRPTLLDPGGITIPVVSVTADAVALLEEGADADVRLEVETELPPSTFRNVIGQLGDGPRIVMVGAHLDSVLDGPGINDNGSGVAATLEVARLLAEAGIPDGWALRVGFWGAEEFGTIGSRAYVDGLDDEVVAYLNLDMTGSINGANLVYDEAGAAPGSDQITAAFVGALEARGEASEPMDLGGSSDHFGFVQAGIPTGGLFAGATPTGGASRPSSGGGGPAPDPCYHIGCDDLTNVDLERATLFAEVTADVVRVLMTGG